MLAGLLVGLVVPTAAQASGGAVIKDCTTNGRLTKSYSQSDYASALSNLPTDVDEYTDCRDVIKQAQLGAAGGGSSSGSNGGGSNGSGSGSTGGGGSSSGGSSGGAGSQGGGSAPSSSASSPKNASEALEGASKDEAAAVAAARAAGAQTPVVTGTNTSQPIDLSKSEVSSLGSIPTPLLIALALLAGASLAGGGSAVLNRVRAHRRPA